METKTQIPHGMNTEERLTRLETLDEQREKQRLEMLEELKEANKGIYELKVLIAQKLTCPSPGLCVALQTQLDEMYPAVRSLEDSRTEAKAGGKVLLAVAGAVATASGILGGLLVKLWPSGVKLQGP